MNDIKARPTKMHERLLILSYVLSSVSTLIGALAAIGATVDQDGLLYPPVSAPVPPMPTIKNIDAGKPSQ